MKAKKRKISIVKNRNVGNTIQNVFLLSDFRNVLIYYQNYAFETFVLLFQVKTFNLA
jgi:hypothetical protein